MEKTILPIVGYGSQILREPTIEASDSKESKEVIESLKFMMNKLHTSVGLAAPQINSNLSIFIMQIGATEQRIIINPLITNRKGVIQSTESCLSIPGVVATVLRSKQIEMEYLDEKFKKNHIKLEGFDAVVAQHEFCHLNGVLITDQINRAELKKIDSQLFELEKGSTKTYYDMIFLGQQEPIKYNAITT